MALMDYKIDKYKEAVADLPDVPSTGGYDAKKLKEYFDGKANTEIKEAINAIIDFLVVLSGNETIKGFKAIIGGEMDEYPEAAFYNVGSIEDVKAKAEQLKKEQQ